MEKGIDTSLFGSLHFYTADSCLSIIIQFFVLAICQQMYTDA